MKLLVFNLFAACLLCLPATTFSAVVIDDFAGPSFAQQLVAGVTYTRTDTGLAGTVGGSRALSATQLEPPVGSASSIEIVTGWGLAINNQGSNYSWFALEYDAQGAGLDQDFSDITDFVIQWDADHLAGGKSNWMKLTLTDSTVQSASDTIVWDQPIHRPSPELYEVRFPSSRFAGINMADIFRVALEYESDYANDVIFSQFRAETIPEPSSAWCFLLVMFVVARRRRATAGDI